MKKRLQKIIKEIVMLLMVLILTVSSLPIERITAATKNTTIEQYIKLLVKAMELEVDSTQEHPYIAAAMKSGIILDGEFTDTSKEMTRAECALLTNRADEVLHGKSDLEEMFQNIVDLNRISDIAKINKKYKEAVVRIFGKGIIVGYSNGKYSQSRQFKGSDKISYSGAKIIIGKLISKKKRSVMSPDGQLTRTTNLPVNAKEYDYILASFPNKFYTMRFDFERGTYDEFPDYIDEYYYTPARIRKKPFETGSYKGTAKETQDMLDEYLYDWVEVTEDHLKYYFNVDYRTVDSKWVKNLLSTYYTANETQYNDLKEKINEYVKAIKKNKVKIECVKAVVEPSTVYHSFSGFYLRTYVKYRIVSAKDINGTVFFGEPVFKTLKVGEWREGYYDIDYGCGYWSYGEDVKIDRIYYFSDYAMLFKSKILKLTFNKKEDNYSYN